MARRLTLDEFKDRVENMYDGEYEVIGKYKNSKTKIDIKHNICGNIYNPLPNDFLRGRSTCPTCSGNYKRTTEDFKKEVFDLTGDEYVVLGEYISAHNPILIRHNICGNEYYGNRNGFLKGHRCPKCSVENRVEKRTFSKKHILNFISSKGYEYVSGEYKNAYSDLQVKCSKKHTFTTKYVYLYSNIGCPICNASRGEKMISKWLDNNDIDYDREFIFKDLVSINNGYPRFDFVIYNTNNEIHSLVEYDGIQHFEHRDFLMTEKEFNTLQANDNLKNVYCIENNIELLRISYKDFNNIENILDKHLKQQQSA